MNINDAPYGAVTVVGTPTLGQTLYANTSTLGDADGLGQLHYQWLRDGEIISDALANSYTLGFADAGTSLNVRVTYVDGFGTVEQVESAGTLPVGGRFYGTSGDDLISASAGDDYVSAGQGDDTLLGLEGHDTLYAGDGADLVDAGDGDDIIYGGSSSADRRDRVYGGNGDDSIDGGHGNDELRGDAGQDTLVGGYGEDELFGGVGDDILTGSAWSDLLFGGDGNDLLNGGYGNDRLNGGLGADRFLHTGVLGHGADWVQDYVAAEGDVLLFGDNSASASDFGVNFAHTPNAGNLDLSEAFVVYRPTGQILWALIDGEAQGSIVLRIDGVDYDLF